MTGQRIGRAIGMSIPPILLVGCGRMGSAMLAGWREQGLAPSVAVDPAPEAAAPAGPDLTVVAGCGCDSRRIRAGGGGVRGEAAERRGDAAAVSALRRDRRCSCRSWPVGPSAGCGALLGDAAAIVRAMPNTPAAVRQGVTVACPGAGVMPAQRALCERLLQAIGVVAWVEDEALLDPVTAVSGSGPAYVFLLAELMEQAAIEQGIPARPGAAAGAADGVRLGRAAGGEPGGRGRACARR